jgi:hypothetical protein
MMDAIVHSNAPMNQIGTCTTIASDENLAKRNEITNQSNREYFYTKIYGENWDSWNWQLQRRIDNDWTTEVPAIEETTVGTFRNEEPDLHWPGVNVQDRVVLDLGAGDFGRVGTQSYPGTPDHWLANGAAKVVAVDMEEKDLQNYTDPRIETIAMSISGPEEISNLIQEHQPDLVKADIEGAEKYFLNIFPDVLRIPKAYAIETHDRYLFENISSMLSMLGYKIIWQMHHEIEDYVSVIYAERMF